MADPDTTTPDILATLPIQATGSGVADLEIAYEQMQLRAEDAGSIVPDVPAEDGADAIESAAHPS